VAKKESELRRLVFHLEDQGCRVRQTKKGWFIQFPDGTGTALHKTGSDVRGPKNLRAQVRRAGMNWPSWALH
jgi:hypothetical protein